MGKKLVTVKILLEKRKEWISATLKITTNADREIVEAQVSKKWRYAWEMVIAGVLQRSELLKEMLLQKIENEKTNPFKPYLKVENDKIEFDKLISISLAEKILSWLGLKKLGVKELTPEKTLIVFQGKI